MSVERITVSLPSQVKESAQRLAEQAGVPLSSVVSEALQAWTRGRLADAWLADYQAEFGEFTEDELRRIAAETGAMYVPPAGRAQSA